MMTLSKWHMVTSSAITCYLQVTAGWILWHIWASSTMRLVTEAGKMHTCTYIHTTGPTLKGALWYGTLQYIDLGNIWYINAQVVPRGSMPLSKSWVFDYKICIFVEKNHDFKTAIRPFMSGVLACDPGRKKGQLVSWACVRPIDQCV